MHYLECVSLPLTQEWLSDLSGTVPPGNSVNGFNKQRTSQSDQGVIEIGVRLGRLSSHPSAVLIFLDIEEPYFFIEST